MKIKPEGNVKRFSLNEGYLVAKALSFNKSHYQMLMKLEMKFQRFFWKKRNLIFFWKKYKGSSDIELISKDYEIELERATAVTQNDPILVGRGRTIYYWFFIFVRC